QGASEARGGAVRRAAVAQAGPVRGRDGARGEGRPRPRSRRVRAAFAYNRRGMGLMEFLRQWQRGRLATGVAVSVAIHLALAALLLWGGLPAARYDVKRGEPLIVDLPKAEDSPPPGLGGTPACAPG